MIKKSDIYKIAKVYFITNFVLYLFSHVEIIVYIILFSQIIKVFYDIPKVLLLTALIMLIFSFKRIIAFTVYELTLKSCLIYLKNNPLIIYNNPNATYNEVIIKIFKEVNATIVKKIIVVDSIVARKVENNVRPLFYIFERKNEDGWYISIFRFIYLIHAYLTFQDRFQSARSKKIQKQINIQSNSFISQD